MAITVSTLENQSLVIQERTFRLVVGTPLNGVPTIQLAREHVTTIGDSPASIKQFGYQFALDAEHQKIVFSLPPDVANAAGLQQVNYTLGQMAIIVAAACDAAAAYEAAKRTGV